MQMAIKLVFNLIIIVLECIVFGMTIGYDAKAGEIEKDRESEEKHGKHRVSN